MRFVVGLLVCGSLFGCGDDGGDASPGDAGPMADASGADAGARDLGVEEDAAVPPDAPPEQDAGPPAACSEPFAPVADPGEPPFSGTSFVTDDLLTDDDPTSFLDLTYTGTGSRVMYDRRPAAFITLEAHLFDARFGAETNQLVEVQVNPEMSREEAEAEARKYVEVIGRLPAFLFRDLDTVWIHRGMNPFGGGNRNLLIHTEQGESYEATGSLEEIFVHEGAHTSMDAYHADAPRWIEAQEADGVAVSTYARDFPMREDVAETLGPYLAVQLASDRVDAATEAQIRAAIPNRILYFDCFELSMAILP